MFSVIGHTYSRGGEACVAGCDFVGDVRGNGAIVGDTRLMRLMIVGGAGGAAVDAAVGVAGGDSVGSSCATLLRPRCARCASRSLVARRPAWRCSRAWDMY